MSLMPQQAACHLVVGYSESPRGEQALHHAVRLAGNRSDIRLIVTYVTSLAQVTLLSGGMPEAVGPLMRQEADMAIHLAARAESQLRGYMVEWRFLHKCGNVVDELCAIANGVNSAGIVVGRPRAVRRRVGGSVPARLARSASQQIFVA
jgi:nucleotide-binding universal stress UspA family protein